MDRVAMISRQFLEQARRGWRLLLATVAVGLLPAVAAFAAPVSMTDIGLAMLNLENTGDQVEASWSVDVPVQQSLISLGPLAPGKTQHRINLPDLAEPETIQMSLWVQGARQVGWDIAWQPQKRWEVHLVHGSHHDLGYTDLPSNILREHDAYLDQVVQFCEETDNWPDESRFHYVAEQAWSVLHYLEHRPTTAVEKLVRLLQTGLVEVNAFLDNVTSELCGHEEQVRLVYPAFRLKRRYGIPIRTAELNDIPGISWGLVSVLSGCGVRWFAPAIQDYFAWGGKVHPHWDEQVAF